MAAKIAVISQKGGVGKSSVARAIARQFQIKEWRVKLCDFDVKQGTSLEWARRRLDRKIDPAIETSWYRELDECLRHNDAHYDLLVFDGRAQADELSAQLADVADVVVIPTGTSVDDLEPSVKLAHALVKRQIRRDKMRFALCRAGKSERRLNETRAYLSEAGYQVLGAVWYERDGYKLTHDAGRTGAEAPQVALRASVKQLVEEVGDVLAEQLKAKEAA